MTEKTMQKPKSPLLRKSDAAEYLSISVRTIDRLIKSGVMPYYRLGQNDRMQKKGIVMLNKKDLDRWLEGQRIEAIQ